LALYVRLRTWEYQPVSVADRQTSAVSVCAIRGAFHLLGARHLRGHPAVLKVASDSVAGRPARQSPSAWPPRLRPGCLTSVVPLFTYTLPDNQGTASKSPRHRHPEGDRCSLSQWEYAMRDSLRQRERLRDQDSAPPICPPCPTCGGEMRLVSVTPARKSVVYEYQCGNDHLLEFTIGDG